MKRILIFSDSHGDTDRCMEIINKYRGQLDMVIHAGDTARDAEDLSYIYDDIPFKYVRGNSDIVSSANGDLIVLFGGIKIFVTHGHGYKVKYEMHYSTLVKKAQELDADLCVFGHTHIPYTAFEGKLTVINPGSVRYGGTYAIAEIEEGEVKTAILNY